jgi:hypothetical protein
LQFNGQVWLGTAYGIVQSWSNTQIVAAVANGSTFGSAQAQQNSFAARAKAERQARMDRLHGVAPDRSHAQAAPPSTGGSGSSNVQVLQNGVWSNQAPFGVNILQITGVSPASAGPGTAVTISGAGFGGVQGSGSVWLGSMAGQVQSWSDTQVVAVVAPGSLTGIVRIQQNGAWSNALTFTLPGNTTKPVPNQSATAQFIQVMTTIGTGIGNIAAHETGHQLNLPQMDCSNGIKGACSEDHIYQNGNSSGEAMSGFTVLSREPRSIGPLTRNLRSISSWA